MARRFYAPALVTTRPAANGQLEIWATNDKPEPVKGTLDLRVMEFGGGMARRERLKVNLPAGSARLIKRYKLADLAPVPEATFLSLALTAGGETFRNEHFFQVYKKCDLAAARIVTRVKQDGKTFRVTVSCNKPAFYVSLNADGIRGEFDDNCITLLPGESRTLVFTPKQAITLKAFKAGLQVHHLRGTYS